MGELELAALALLDVLDVGQEEARAVGGVRDDAVAQADPDVRAVPAAQAELGAAALGGGPQQRAYVLGVDQVGERVAAHRGGRAAQQPAQGVVGAQDPAVLVAAHLGDGHAGRGVLEGLPEAFLARPQGLLLALQPDQGALHVGAQPGVADRDGGLEGVHLERLAAPGAGPAAVARPIHGEHADQLAARPAALRGGRVHGCEEPVGRVPLVLEAGGGAVGVPLRDVVVVEDPALGVRYEHQVAPVLTHAEAALPGLARADAAGDEGLGRRVPGEGGDDEVAVRPYEVHARQLVPEGGDDALGDGLQCVRQAAGRVHVGHDLVQLSQGRKTDVGLRLGLHARPPPEYLAANQGFSSAYRPGSFPATESQRAAHSVHRVNNSCPL